jgi:hypothetical protein
MGSFPDIELMSESQLAACTLDMPDHSIPASEGPSSARVAEHSIDSHSTHDGPVPSMTRNHGTGSDRIRYWQQRVRT